MYPACPEGMNGTECGEETDVPCIMVPRDIMHRNVGFQVKHVFESLKVFVVSRKQMRISCRVRGDVVAHSASSMANRPLSIMSPRKMTTSGDFLEAKYQLLRRFKSAKTRERKVRKGERSG